MKRLSEAAGLDIDDDHGYLTPHGGRRGVGEVMVREFGYAAAARYLDNSEEQVREAYQHIEAADRADQATRALSRTDQRAVIANIRCIVVKPDSMCLYEGYCLLDKQRALQAAISSPASNDAHIVHTKTTKLIGSHCTHDE
jgi:ABC-type molybdenum transport system ATPase subunit/photorepair protein PhrA